MEDVAEQIKTELHIANGNMTNATTAAVDEVANSTNATTAPSLSELINASAVNASFAAAAAEYVNITSSEDMDDIDERLALDYNASFFETIQHNLSTTIGLKERIQAT